MAAQRVVPSSGKYRRRNKLDFYVRATFMIEATHGRKGPSVHSPDDEARRATDLRFDRVMRVTEQL
jgi:hypothetical protein